MDMGTLTQAWLKVSREHNQEFGKVGSCSNQYRGKCCLSLPSIDVQPRAVKHGSNSLSFTMQLYQGVWTYQVVTPG
jgi:hypothetical protein